MINRKSFFIALGASLLISMVLLAVSCSTDSDSDNKKNMMIIAAMQQNSKSSNSSGGSGGGSAGGGGSSGGNESGSSGNTGTTESDGYTGGASQSVNDVVEKGPGASDQSALQGMTGGTITSNADAPKIIESQGYLNSAYIIFEQVTGASEYTVKVDNTPIDAELIRTYDTYKYNIYDTTTNSWQEKTLSKVARADALGLKAGTHSMSVSVKGATAESTATGMSVIDHDRSGYAFTGSGTPGAYNKDGTLKSGAVVVYVTEATKKTVKARLSNGEFTGIGNITQNLKKATQPVCIRIVGQVGTGTNGNYSDVQSADMKSAFALGVKAAKNVTIEGVGHDATLKGAGVAAFGECENIEIANLGLINWGGGHDGDGVSIKASSYVWVHNNDIFYGNAGSDGDQAKGDGSMDLKDDSNHMTISYNHFWDSGKMSLCGMKSESGPNLITYHHNWFDHSDSRHPRIRRMTVHVYNNYFDGNAKYGVGVTSGGSVFVENNYFRNAHDPMMSSNQGTDAQGAGTFSGEPGGVIKSWNNKFVECGTNGVKFQFITNKRDYNGITGELTAESGKSLGKQETVQAEVGDAIEGGFEIVNATVKADSGFVGKGTQFISKEDGALKNGDYYQASAGKTACSVKVPANTTKVIVKAKCGSTGRSTTITVNGKTDKIDNADYVEFTYDISGLSSDTVLDIDAGSGGALNVSGIKVIAATKWNVTYTTGIASYDIDAYEVDSRDAIVPDSVYAKDGKTKYDNENLAVDKLGLSKTPSNPDVAKGDVIVFSGRHNSDLVWNFDPAKDDASYALNQPLKDKLNAYETCVKAIQQGTGGSVAGGSAGGTGSEGGSSSSGGSSSGGSTPSTPPTVEKTPDDITYPTDTLKAGTYTSKDMEKFNATLINNSGKATVAADAITVYPNDYLAFHVDSTCHFVAAKIGNTQCKIVKSDGTVALEQKSNTTIDIELEPGDYYLTSAHSTKYTKLKATVTISY